MSSVLHQPWTVASLLEWEERQDRPFEFDGFQSLAMNGGTIAHDRIGYNIRRALDARLPAGRCRHFGPTMKVAAGGSIRYPDVVVSCAAQRNAASMVQSLLIVFEVLGRSTSRADRIDKVRDDLAVDSVVRYVILEQDSIATTVFERAGRVRQATTLTSEDVLALPKIAVSIPLTECYVGADPVEPDDAA